MQLYMFVLPQVLAAFLKRLLDHTLFLGEDPKMNQFWFCLGFSFGKGHTGGRLNNYPGLAETHMGLYSLCK